MKIVFIVSTVLVFVALSFSATNGEVVVNATAHRMFMMAVLFGLADLVFRHR